MVTDLVFDPLVPLSLLALAAVASVALAGFAALRGLAGWALRLAAALVLLVALANPVLRRQEREPLSDIVLVVVDRTASNALEPRPAQLEQAVAALKTRLGRAATLEMRRVDVTDAPPDSDAGTLLMAALDSIAASVPRARIAGAILITDGQVHDMAAAPADFPAPVHVLLSGRRAEWDRRLSVVRAPAFAIMGEQAELVLRISDLGLVPGAAGGMADLLVAVDGGSARRLRVRVGEELHLPLRLSHGGRNVLRFSTPPVAGELTVRNNVAVVEINGIRDRLRVLLVSGEPHAGERTWRNLLKSDPSVDLVHFTILRPPGKEGGVPVNELSLIAFPTQELFLDKVGEFDLIIFDRYRLRGILPSLYLENVARYVENGGAVLVAAGPAFAGAGSLYRSPLARVLPARPTARVFETGFLPRIPPLGARHPVTRALGDYAPRPAGADGSPGWGRWFRMVETVPLRGSVVMTGPEGKPLLILDRVGKGRVALLASDQAWLWHRGFEGGGPQLELLRRLAHWMMKEPELEEEALTAGAHGREVTVTRRSLAQMARVVTVTGPDGVPRPMAMTETEPGLYTVRFRGEENGLYRLAEGGLKAVVALGPAAPREYENAIGDPSALAPLIAATRGGVHRLEDGIPDIRFVRAGRVASGRGWLGLVRRHAFVTRGITLLPLTPALLVLLLAAGFMLAAWRREGE